MDLSARVELNGWDRRLLNAGEVVGEESVVLVDRLALIGEAEGKRGTPVFRGHARRSVTKGQPRRRGAGAESDYGSNLGYYKVIEKGRRPGRPMPPKGVLLPWMRRKGIPASAEYVVRRKIGVEGIPAKEPLKKALVVVRRRLPAERQRAQRRIVARLGGLR